MVRLWSVRSVVRSFGRSDFVLGVRSFGRLTSSRLTLRSFGRPFGRSVGRFCRLATSAQAHNTRGINTYSNIPKIPNTY